MAKHGVYFHSVFCYLFFAIIVIQVVDEPLLFFGGIFVRKRKKKLVIVQTYFKHCRFRQGETDGESLKIIHPLSKYLGIE